MRTRGLPLWYRFVRGIWRDTGGPSARRSVRILRLASTVKRSGLVRERVRFVIRDLSARGVAFEEYGSPKTINFIAQIGPARGAWFKDPDGNVFGVREGPVPGVR